MLPYVSSKAAPTHHTTPPPAREPTRAKPRTTAKKHSPTPARTHSPTATRTHSPTGARTQSPTAAPTQPPAKPVQPLPAWLDNSRPVAAPLSLAPKTPLLPKQLGDDGLTLDRQHRAAPTEQDPRGQLIELGKNVRNVDGKVQELTQQPIDIPKARRQIEAADERHTQFLRKAVGALSSKQLRTLRTLQGKFERARGEQKEGAQAKFGRALEGMLSHEQRGALLELTRAAEDARLNLQGQQIAKRINDARGGKGDEKLKLKAPEALSLALADGRALVATRMQLQANRKVQDAYSIVMTPDARKKLAQPQQELLSATRLLQQKPNDPAAKQRLNAAKMAFDNAYNGAINVQDRAAIAGFEAQQKQTEMLAGTLGDEANGERKFYELRTLGTKGATPADQQRRFELAQANGGRTSYELRANSAKSAPTADQQRRFKLAQAQFNLILHNRGMRNVALQIGATTDHGQLKTLDKRLDGMMGQSLRMRSDLTVQERQLNFDRASEANQTWIATHGAPGPKDVAPTLQAVNDARQLLDLAKHDRLELEQSLKPPKVEKKSGWDRALDIGMAVGEIAGGVALALTTSWTGVGVASTLIVADGVVRLGHSVTDAARGTDTDPWISAGAQKLGVSRNTANRIDTGANLLSTAPVGIGGAALTAWKATGLILKGTGALGVVLSADSAQAQARYALGGDAVTPFTITQLQSAGLTQTQANYVLMGGGLIGPIGLAKVAAGRAPGAVHEGFHTFDDGAPARPAATPLPEHVPLLDGEPPPGLQHTPKAPAGGSSAEVRTADWYGRGAPKEVRQALAAQALGPDASPRAVTRLANSYRPNPLVVIRAVPEEGATGGTIVGGGTVRNNSTGRFGRDGLGQRIKPHTAEITPVIGDGVIRQQVIAATALGVERFTKQNGAFWQTSNPEDSGLVTDAKVKHQRIRRDAPETLAQLPEAARPSGVTEALTPSSSTTKQLKQLNEIAPGDRTAWPVGTQDLVYQLTFDRPLSAFGKIVHWMPADSWVGWTNMKFNPATNILKRWEKLRPPAGPETIQWVNATDKHGPRIVKTYPAGTMPRHQLQQLAEGDVKANAKFGKKVHVGRLKEEERMPYTLAKLEKQDLVVVFDVDSASGAHMIAGSASLTPNFKGLGVHVRALPWLSDRQYGPRTTYLSDVFSDSPGAGKQAVLAAEKVARDGGARKLDFFTQWKDAQGFYDYLGVRRPGGPAPEGAAMPGLTMYEARFTKNAGEILFNTPRDQLPNWLGKKVARADSVAKLQDDLDAMGPNQYHYAGRVPDGTLLTSYHINYSPASRTQAMRWGLQDAGHFLHDNVWSPAVGVVKLPFSALGTGVRFVAPYARWANERINPYGLSSGIEAGRTRAFLQNAGYAMTYARKQGWAMYRGAVIDAAALQAVTGNVHVMHNDDRATRPFNGAPGALSYSVYFPWTGTLVATWGKGPHGRLPALPKGMEFLENAPGVNSVTDPKGLQPLARASAPLTDPKGPKGAGFLTAARAMLAEGTVGIRWFGNNDGVSALTAVSIRLSPLNANLRGDVPIQPGGARGLSFLSSWSAIMPSVSHSFYVGPGGLMVRNLHLTLSNSAQTRKLSQVEQSAAYRAGDHWTWGTNKVTTGSGLFFTLNPAYGAKEIDVG